MTERKRSDTKTAKATRKRSGNNDFEVDALEVSASKQYDSVTYVLQRRTLVRVFDADGIEVDSYIDAGSAAQTVAAHGSQDQGVPGEGRMLTLGRASLRSGGRGPFSA